MTLFFQLPKPYDAFFADFDDEDLEYDDVTVDIEELTPALHSLMIREIFSTNPCLKFTTASKEFAGNENDGKESGKAVCRVSSTEIATELPTSFFQLPKPYDAFFTGAVVDEV
jgi:hypothetical protein